MAARPANKPQGVRPDEVASMVVDAMSNSTELKNAVQTGKLPERFEATPSTMEVTTFLGITTIPFRDGSKMTISIAPDVVRLSFVCHKAGVEKFLVINRTGNAVKTIADLL